jgi:hypothetical protein
MGNNMQLTATMITTRRGTILALDQRRRDALADYAKMAAEDAGMPAQAWVRKTWDFNDYEAKHLLKGDASEPMWERILKHPNGGWAVAIPIMGSVVGQSLEDYIKKQAEAARREQLEWEARERHIAALSAGARGRRPDAGARSYAMWGLGPEADDLGASDQGRALTELHHRDTKPRKAGG